LHIVTAEHQHNKDTAMQCCLFIILLSQLGQINKDVA